MASKSHWQKAWPLPWHSRVIGNLQETQEDSLQWRGCLGTPLHFKLTLQGRDWWGLPEAWPSHRSGHRGSELPFTGVRNSWLNHFSCHWLQIPRNRHQTNLEFLRPNYQRLSESRYPRGFINMVAILPQQSVQKTNDSNSPTRKRIYVHLLTCNFTSNPG